MKKLHLLFLMGMVCFYVYPQEKFIYTKHGKIQYEYDYSKICIETKDGIPETKQKVKTNTTLDSIAEHITYEDVEGAAMMYIHFNDKYIGSDDKLKKMVHELKKDENIIGSYPFIKSKEGISCGITNTILLWLKDNDDIKNYEKYLNEFDIKKLKQSKYFKQVYTFETSKDPIELVNILHTSDTFKCVEVDFISNAEELTFDPAYYLDDGMHMDYLSFKYGGLIKYFISQAIEESANSGRSGKGCVLFASAGNDGEDEVEFPASAGQVIAVGATDFNHFTSANWSNYGSGLSFMAPGEDIITTDIIGPNGGDSDYAWKYSQDYLKVEGTSYSSPFAAGVAALVLSLNPNLTRLEVKHILESTCDKVGYYSYNKIYPM